MNVLLVTKNPQDAGIIETELAKRIPGLHIDTAREVPHAIRRLTSPGGFSAVLLDASPHEADSIALIQAAHAEAGPTAVIALVAATDPDSGTRLVNSGADDYVIRNAGFVDSLASVLRRACAGAPRILYSIGGVDSTAVPDRRSAKPITAAATRVLVRNGEGSPAGRHADRTDADPEENLPGGEALSDLMEKARREMEALSLDGPLPELELEQPIMKEESSRPREHDLEQQLQAVENENARLLQILRELEIQSVSKTEELQREREQWGLFRLALNRKLTAIENKHAGLERAVHEEEQQKRKLAEAHAAEMSRSENTRYAWEKWYRGAAEENVRLKEALQAAEARVANCLEQHRLETAQWETERLAAEQRNRELQERIALMEKSNAKLEHERRELGNHADAMAEELRRLIETHTDLIGKLAK